MRDRKINKTHRERQKVWMVRLKLVSDDTWKRIKNSKSMKYLSIKRMILKVLIKFSPFEVLDVKTSKGKTFLERMGESNIK